jgi:hypothetical protein
MRISLTLAVGLAASVAAGSAPAGQVRGHTLASLVRNAEAVVLARCDPSASEWDGDPPIIVTRHHCRIEQAFKGDPGTTVTVQTLGGRVGDVTMTASAGATLAGDAAFVLLLQRSAFGDYFVVAGGADGALRVSGAYAQRAVAGMPLETFGRWVRDVSR